METLVVDHETLEIITSLAKELHTSETDVVQQAVRRYVQQTGKKSRAQRRKPKLLQVGKQCPFKPFKAIKMVGKGPTASEMVIQDRL
jgi:hypothetical protein